MSEHDCEHGGPCPGGAGGGAGDDAGAAVPSPITDSGPAGLGRRDFIRTAGAGAGLLLSGGVAGLAAGEAPPSPNPIGAPAFSSQIPDVVVVGAGAFGGWTSYYLQEMGARVVMVDKYGPANSRATSGGETRGVRSAYGGRPVAELWMRWANEAIARWRRFDEEWGERYLPRMFFPTGDLILRESTEPLLDESMRIWDAMGVPYEVLDGDEVRYRWPVIGNTENVGIAVHEVNAGVVRARRAMEAVATVFTRGGGEIVVAEARKPTGAAGRVSEIELTPGDRLRGGTFVYALGPWFPKVFPELMGNRMRIPLGHTFYFGTPPGSNAYEWPHLPSYNVPGCTGWPALPPDNRGFRVRTGGRPPQDPDESVRWVDDEYFDRPLQILETWFPALLRQPLLETRACHYESPIGRNFIIDEHPDHPNVWLTGGGSAEAFKQGPVLGEYIAARVLGRDLEPDLAEGFRIPEEEYEPQAP